MIHIFLRFIAPEKYGFIISPDSNPLMPLF